VNGVKSVVDMHWKLIELLQFNGVLISRWIRRGCKLECVGCVGCLVVWLVGLSWVSGSRVGGSLVYKNLSASAFCRAVQRSSSSSSNSGVRERAHNVDISLYSWRGPVTLCLVCLVCNFPPYFLPPGSFSLEDRFYRPTRRVAVIKRGKNKIISPPQKNDLKNWGQQTNRDIDALW
jgi:hypothetical protein